jgi:hypothetical protein
MQDPFHDQRRLMGEQEIKHREEQGIYQSYNWTMRAGISFLIAIIILGIVIVVLRLF